MAEVVTTGLITEKKYTKDTHITLSAILAQPAHIAKAAALSGFRLKRRRYDACRGIRYETTMTGGRGVPTMGRTHFHRGVRNLHATVLSTDPDTLSEAMPVGLQTRLTKPAVRAGMCERTDTRPATQKVRPLLQTVDMLRPSPYVNRSTGVVFSALSLNVGRPRSHASPSKLKHFPGRSLPLRLYSAPGVPRDESASDGESKQPPHFLSLPVHRNSAALILRYWPPPYFQAILGPHVVHGLLCDLLNSRLPGTELVLRSQHTQAFKLTRAGAQLSA
ncbi:hypothetical protein V8C86DRAFT_3034331 [Haematococcus lacustris]